MGLRAKLLTIGQLADVANVTPRALRYYEQHGLLRPAGHTQANYRLYDRDSIEQARFIAKCRSLGFSITEINELLLVLNNSDFTCAQVAALCKSHLAQVDDKIKDLAEIRRSLGRNLERCTGAEVPECAVLDFLKKSDGAR